MTVDGLSIPVRQLPGAVPCWHGVTNRNQWRELAVQARGQGGRLVSLWGSDQSDHGRGFEIHLTVTLGSALLWATLPVAQAQDGFPDLSDVFPAANRMQRTVFDMLGVPAMGAADQRQWLRHAAWPAQVYPLRKSVSATAAFENGKDEYPFVQVTGDGVHEIPVGPVHAGIIEPGHFRFSVVGERVLRLEERLGYKHKGIEKRFEGMQARDAARLAGRVSCDSTVAFAWAYSMAYESAALTSPPPRACWLRALLLERERIANHLGDLGFLANDAGLAFGLAQLSRLKEDVLRMNQAAFGHRYAMDVVVPGGLARNVENAALHSMIAQGDALLREVRELKDILEDHPGLQDRFIGAGRVEPELADRLGLTGLAGRASGIAADLRVQFGCAPYDQLDVHMATHRNGDVAARVIVRFEELFASFAMCNTILHRLPAGDVFTEPSVPPAGSIGVGWVEGWRGEVMVAIETGVDGSLRRVHPHDPSWHNWPVLEHAILGNIVPDFPLINKSFNMSYAGVDL
jgi:Ni,Fe-hydrogenase III large subunit/Ni,Fe-hydrogenase III component G